MKQFVRKGLVMIAGFVSVPAVVSHADSSLPKPECRSTDVRFRLLKSFFHQTKSPIEYLSSVFIQEADANNLDWRLLPSLSYLETGAGRSSHGNNIFGWNNGGSSFRTVYEGIHSVAESLARGKSYRGKSLGGKLTAYNPNAGYRESVEAVMARISSVKF